VQSARELLARRLGEGRAETLVRLFGIALPTDAVAAARAVAPVDLDELVAAGLVARDDGCVRALVRIVPHDGLLIASDPDVAGAERPEFVTGVNPSARSLARLTLRRPAASALDLGTGSGIQALLAAGHCDTVTAIDVNPRALAYLRLNLRLNRVANVEPLEGSWFEPVRGRRFELVVANPPYVVSPDAAHVFKDSGLPVDAASRLVVEEAAEHLDEGGVAQLFCNWVHGRDEDWRDPVEEWVRGRGVDALLLRYESTDPLDYAVTWNRPLAGDPTAFGAALDRWLAYDAHHGIERIAFGLVVLRRRSGGRNRVRAVEVPGAPTAGAGAQIERMLAAWDAPLGEAELGGAVLRPVEGARLRRALEAHAGGWRSGRGRLSLEASIGLAVPLDDGAAAVVARCDGRATVREAISRVAVDHALDEEALAATALPALRRLYDLGCLERVPA
jgi:methylase of polypeptide subunit release factors